MLYNRHMDNKNNNGVIQGLEGHYDFDSIKEGGGLTINGKTVGQDPSNFERSEIYKKNFDKMGNGTENIKIIKNFISDIECNLLTDLIHRFGKVQEFPVQWDNEFKPTVTRKTYTNLPSVLKYVPLVQNELEKEYGFPVKNKSVSVARWDAGDNLGLHVDDLGTTSTNHMATLIYINNDYEGGEIVFPTHNNFTHKPVMGDLIMFPGNQNYPHEVLTITSGMRYSIPMWFEFV